MSYFPSNLAFIFCCVKLLVLYPYQTYGFNIAPKATHVYSYEGYPGRTYTGRPAYFGYSVGLLQNMDDKTFWVVAGAPRHNTSTSPDPLEAGGLFKCQVKDGMRDHCTEVILDTDRNYQSYGKFSEVIPFRDNAWTGATIDVDSYGTVLTCAPLWKNAHDKSIYRLNGMCYEIDYKLGDNNINLIRPLEDKNRQLISLNGQTFYFYSSGQAGLSIQYTEDDNPIIGAPGVYNWFGTVAIITKKREVIHGGSNKRSVDTIRNKVAINIRRRARRQTIHTTISTNIPKPISSGHYISDSDFLGYSVTSGKYYKGRDIVYYAAGAPRGGDSRGLVIIFRVSIHNNQAIQVLASAKGTQIGEYFGASVHSADFDCDGVADLAVGAPLHFSDSLTDMGRVFVFQSKEVKEKILLSSSIQLTGDKIKNGRFGTALGAADLDRNGCYDLFVGAPYENDLSGAIYVFMGSRKGLQTKYSQKLTPEMVAPNLKGFGISFSRHLDVDNNEFPDFTVGSFLSDNVVLLQTRPVLSMGATLSITPSKLARNDSVFTIEACLKVSLRSKLSNLGYNTVIRVNMTQESTTGEVAATFRDGSTTTESVISIQGSEDNCQMFNVDVKQARSNAQNPITVTMDYYLQSTLKTPESPILDSLTTAPVSKLVSFTTDCDKDDDVRCLADLATSVKFLDIDIGAPFLIGSKKHLSLSIEVDNYGEPAFLPNVSLTVKRPLNFNPSADHDCAKTNMENQIILVCMLKNPISKDDSDKLELELDVSQLSDSSTDLTIYTTSNSAADLDTNPSNNFMQTTIKLTREAKLKTSGWSTPEQFIYQRFSEHEMNTTGTINVLHVHQVSKTGVTPVDRVEIVLKIPSFVVRPGGHVLPLATLKSHEMTFQGQTSFCEVTSNVEYSSTKSEDMIPAVSFKRDNIKKLDIGSPRLDFLNCSSGFLECTTISCSIGPWKRYEAANLKVELEINKTTLSQIMTIDRGSYFETESVARITSLPHFTEFEGIQLVNGAVQSFLQPSSLAEKVISWWIILLAVLGGILLLALIAYGLHRAGFFKRKQRDEMKAHKATLLQKNNAQ